jgi:transcriptional regulator of acetoin/glycerol metabolism
MENRKILRAWEKFTQNGTSPSGVRGIVVASWQRSQGYQIPVERSETRVAPEAELVQRRVEHSELIEAAHPALEQAGVLLGNTAALENPLCGKQVPVRRD